jgi:hypothetical protein
MHLEVVACAVGHELPILVADDRVNFDDGRAATEDRLLRRLWSLRCPRRLRGRNDQ